MAEATRPQGKALYVWDFDETILRIHAYGLRIAAEDVAARALDGADGDAADLPFFRATVAAVLARGDAVAVASFGVYEVIQAYLDRLCPGVFSRASVSTPSCVGVPDGCSVPAGKNPQLDQLLCALLTSEGGEASSLPEHRHRVVFFDDSASNVTARARSVCPSCRD